VKGAGSLEQPGAWDQRSSRYAAAARREAELLQVAKAAGDSVKQERHRRRLQCFLDQHLLIIRREWLA
jgi:hypothetical protein